MPKKIIVVDDSESVRQQIGSALDEEGYQFIEADDGRDALAKIDQHPDAALVICDVNMPHVSGVEMVEKLRETGSRPNLPIVMLTSEASSVLMQRARTAGAKGWIVKPFDRNLLLSAVRKLAGNP
jgi:two-component system chemotaxis response regulator CheY